MLQRNLSHKERGTLKSVEPGDLYQLQREGRMKPWPELWAKCGQAIPRKDAETPSQGT